MSIEYDRFAADLLVKSPDPELVNITREICATKPSRRQRNVSAVLTTASVAVAAIPPLWVWACVVLDDLKNRKNSSVAERRIAMVVLLQKEHGYTLKEAEGLIDKTLSAIEKRDKNDGAVAAIVKIAKEVRQLLST